MTAKPAKASIFPPARLKRIIQADEDVGKLAQSTPVAVGKALEGFLRDLVDAAASEAASRNSSKVTSSHFKQAITNTSSFDFLKDAVAHVADIVEKEDDEGKKAKPRKPRTQGTLAKGKGAAKKRKEDSDGDAEDLADHSKTAGASRQQSKLSDDDYDE